MGLEGDWAKFNNDDIAAAFLNRLISNHPELATYFAKISAPVGSWDKDPAARAQARKVFDAVGSVIDNPSSLDAAAKGLAASHAKFPKPVGKAQFAIALDELVAFAAENGGDAGAWNQLAADFKAAI